MNLSILKNKNYVLVVMGRFVSSFGTFLQGFALSLYVLDKTGSTVLFASVIAISMIPRILLMPFAGVIADKFSRKKMVVNMDILSGIFVSAIAILFFVKGELTLPVIYVIVIALNTINVFFEPSMGSIMPDIVEKEKLADANSLMEMSAAVIGLTAPIAAGILYSTLGIFVILVINAASFLLSAFSESAIRIEKESLISRDRKEGFFTSFIKGFQYLGKMPEFLILIGVVMIANFALGPIFTVALPVVIIKDFGLSETVYGLVASLMTAGMLIAPLFATRIIKKYHYSKLVSSILLFSGILCFIIGISCVNGLFPNVYYNTVLMVILINVLMIIVIWVNLATATARQRIVPGNLQGRVFSVSGTVAMMAMPLGQMITGYLLDITKSYIVITAVALLVGIAGVLAKLGYAALERKGRMYKEQDIIEGEFAAENV